LKTSASKVAKISHRRKSSEGCFMVTNEGQRKAIRDFNVFEMKQARRTSMRIVSTSALKQLKNQHQTKRMAPGQKQ